MAAKKKSKVYGHDRVLYRIRAFDQRFRLLALATLDQHAQIIERRMKQEHVWVNRTHEAEEKLHAFVQAEQDHFVLTAAHGAFHGRFLETMTSKEGIKGKYAILRKVLVTQWPRTKAALNKAMKQAAAKKGGITKAVA